MKGEEDKISFVLGPREDCRQERKERKRKRDDIKVEMHPEKKEKLGHEQPLHDLGTRKAMQLEKQVRQRAMRIQKRTVDIPMEQYTTSNAHSMLRVAHQDIGRPWTPEEDELMRTIAKGTPHRKWHIMVRQLWSTLQSERTESECKAHWYTDLVTCRPWTKEEDQRLVDAVDRGVAWNQMYQLFPLRSLQSIQRHW